MPIGVQFKPNKCQAKKAEKQHIFVHNESQTDWFEYKFEYKID